MDIVIGSLLGLFVLASIGYAIVRSIRGNKDK